MSVIIPCRSVLYMPASNVRALEKAKTLDADGIIIDLEDAVAPDAKDEARQNARAALKQGGFGRKTVTIRVNGLDTPWGEADLQAICAENPAAILAPKISSAQQALDFLEKMQAYGASESCDLEVMIETPLGIVNAFDIANASPRVTRLVAGTNDLNKELNTPHTPDRAALTLSLQTIVLAAKAAGKQAIDGVFNNITDPEGFAAECEQGLRYGFDGKTLIHPKQIEPCHAVFTPSVEEIATARRQKEAFEAALKEGKGIAVLDGKILENLHIERANKIIALAEAVAGKDEAA